MTRNTLRRVGGLALALAALCAFAARPVAAQQAAGPDSTRVRTVSFPGALAFTREELQAAIVTAPSRCALLLPLRPLCLLGISRQREYASEDQLRADVLRLRLFYFQRGFRQAKIDYIEYRTSQGIDVIFTVEEGEPVIVRSLAVTGAAAVLSPDVLSQLPLRTGARLDLTLYEATRDTLTARLTNNGYAHAEVLASFLIPADSPHIARVSYETMPGTIARFGAITIEGTKDVSNRVVRRMLSFRPGDLYQENELLRSQRNLFGLEVFQHVQIRSDLDAQPDSLVPITVQVNEANLHRVRVGAGISTSDAINAEGRWTSRNFFGGARRLELRAAVSNVAAPQLDVIPFFETGKGKYGRLSGTLSADFSQPWFFSPYNTFGAGLYVERRSVPNVFVRTARGAYLSLSRNLGFGTTLTVGYRPELTQLDAEEDLIFCVNFVTCSESDIAYVKQAHWLSPVTLTLVRDRSNSLFAPTRGYVFHIDAELAARQTGSDFSYTRLSAELAEYFQLRDGLVLALRLRPGIARPFDLRTQGFQVHPQKRFYAGGPNSVRGYAQFRLGPKLLTADAFELMESVGSGGGAACTPQSINAGQCDASVLEDDRFDVRPVGGEDLLEGNVELRFPLFMDKLRGAAFLDWGQVWNEARAMTVKSLAWTPGFGVRYFSPIGPIRVDLGYNPRVVERVGVYTTELCLKGDAACAPLDPARTYTAGEVQRGQRLRAQQPIDWQPGSGVLKHWQIHFSIGQAF